MSRPPSAIFSFLLPSPTSSQVPLSSLFSLMQYGNPLFYHYIFLLILLCALLVFADKGAKLVFSSLL